MAYATLKQAGEWVGGALSLCYDQDREAIIKLVNLIRSEFYLLPDVHWTVPLCIPINCYNFPCPGSCATSRYHGFNLPNGFVNVIAVWDGRRPVTVTDRFAIYPSDSEWENSDRYISRDMGDQYPFEADPPAGANFHLRFHPRNPADAGKKISIRYVDCRNRRRQNEEITLSDQWVCQEHEIRYVQPNGISLPTDLKGEVVAQVVGGDVIAVYKPHETVPNFRRIRVSGTQFSGRCAQLAVLAERDNVPLFDDGDVVETGNQLIWEDAARWLQLHKKTNSDPGDLKNEDKFYGKFRQGLAEEARKRRGKAERRALRFRGMSGLQSRLVRKRGTFPPVRGFTR